MAIGSSALAQNEPQLKLQRVVTGLERPVFVTAAPGDSNRLFVIEQHAGRIRIVDLPSGTLRSSPLLEVPGVTQNNEQGLLGLAFHPHYASNGFFYVNYTVDGGGAAGHTEVTRYQVQGDPKTAATADPASKTVLLTYNQPEVNHNAGWLDFGKDGMLYIAAGDGGGAYDQHGASGNGQNTSVLLAKILRLNVDLPSPYIPADNPFINDSGKRGEIWALGVRNPWRCSFDRATGNLWIGDVGQDTREEIDVLPAGKGGLNFGWRPREGLIQTPGYSNEHPVTPTTDPIFDYSHSVGNCVIGGYVYRGQAIPGLQGAYFFGDNGNGRFWSLTYDGTNNPVVVERTSELNPSNAKVVNSLTSFGEDAAGELYVCDLASGSIFRIVSTNPISIHLSNVALTGNQLTFQFSATAGQSYIVESRPSLVAGSWQTVTNVTASGSSVPVTDVASDGERFYRVRTP